MLSIQLFLSFWVKEVRDVEGQSQGILDFFEAKQLLCILPNYGLIWQQLHEEQGLYDFVDARLLIGIVLGHNQDSNTEWTKRTQNGNALTPETRRCRMFTSKNPKWEKARESTDFELFTI